VFQGQLVGFLDVMQQDAGGAHGQLLAGEAEPVEGGRVEAVEENPLGEIDVEEPVVLFGQGRPVQDGAERLNLEKGRIGLGKQDLGGLEVVEFHHEPGGRLAVGLLGDQQVAGAHVEEGGAEAVAALEDAGDEIVVLRLQHHVLGDGAGRDDPGDLPLDQLARTGFLELVADGHLVPLLDEAGDIAVHGVVRHAAHGDGLAVLVLVAGGEGDLELPGGDDGILEEHLVEVAQAEQDDLAGQLPLDVVVLAHHRGQVVGHRRALLVRDSLLYQSPRTRGWPFFPDRGFVPSPGRPPATGTGRTRDPETPVDVGGKGFKIF